VSELEERLASGEVAVIVGAGVSMLATGNAPTASWKGLLQDGAVAAARVNSAFREQALEIVQKEIASNYLDNMIGAAEKIARALGAPRGGEYRSWLRKTIGQLRVVDREILEAILSLRALGAVIATTNYDGLIEGASGFRPVTWREGARVERVMRGDEEGVLHLHGFWDDPESVVLGLRSYEDIIRDQNAQAMLRALRFKSTLLFVGCGAGLEDPNFDQFRHWLAEVMSESEYPCYRLARNNEVGELERLHGQNERIRVVGYGDGFAELAPFLKRIAAAASKTKEKPFVSGAAAPAPARLPGRPNCFGRDAEVSALVAAVLGTPPPPVAILGPPGIGKSTIVLAALHHADVATKFGARRHFVRCDDAPSAEGLVAALGRQLGLTTSGDMLGAVLDTLARAPTVLALDNLETPWEPDLLAVEELLGRLASVPGVALVAAVRGNEKPDGVAWTEPLRPKPLDLPAARQAFLAIAGDRFASDPDLDPLLQQLDRLPLALSLMAHVSEAEPSLATVRQRWSDERTTMLRRSDGASRLTNIEVSLELSLASRRLTAPARKLLGILALLPAGAAATDVSDLLGENAAPHLSSARKCGLLFDDGGRVRLLAPVREWLARAHPAAVEDRRRVHSFFVALATQGDSVGHSGGANASRRLRPEAANVEEILRAVASAPEPPSKEVITATIAWGRFVVYSGVGGAAALSFLARRLGEVGDVRKEASCIRSLGNIALARSKHDEARSRYEEALPLYRKVGDVRGEANCIESLGDIALARSKHDEARSRYEEALPLYRNVGDILGEANCIQSLGDIALEWSRHDEARSRYEEALPLYRKVGTMLGEANCIQRLGDIALERSKHDEARSRYEEALPLYRQVGDVLGEASSIVGLGDVALERSKYEEARRLYEEALPLHRQVGDVLGEANCIQRLGDIAMVRSNREEARQAFHSALVLYDKIPEPYSIGRICSKLAAFALDPADARAHLVRAREAWLSIDRPDLVAQLDLDD
jgi:tetratricopeptide (TPR) repeat protein